MKKNGFTLIEILSIVVVLGIIALFAFPNISNNSKANKEKEYEKIVSTIESSARAYFSSNLSLKRVTLDTLKEEGLISNTLKNPITDTEIDGCVNVVNTNGVRSYIFSLNCSGSVNLTVDYNGGTSNQSFSSTYMINDEIVLENPSKSGFAFKNWIVISGDSEINGNLLTIGTTDTTIYAVYDVITSLTVNLNGGSTSQTFNQTYTSGSTIILENPTKSGYEFKGWEVTSGNSILSGNTLTIGTTATEIDAEWDSYFTTYITSLYNSGSSGLIKDSYNNIRYSGTNPNNYVTFNGEQWRVVGVFVDSGDTRVKLVRQNSIGTFVFDSSASGVNGGYGINQWGPSGTYSGADLYTLLNDTYYLSKSGTCYVGQNNSTESCNFSNTGIKSETRNLIANATWNAGATTKYSSNANTIPTASEFYEGEHSSNGGKLCSSGTNCNDTVTRKATASGYVGLIGASDYKYAGGINSYLYHSNSMSLLSIYGYVGNARAMYSVYTSSSQNDSSKVGTLYCTGDRLNVYPAVYLEADVIHVSGDGTSGNPFIISR